MKLKHVVSFRNLISRKILLTGSIYARPRTPTSLYHNPSHTMSNYQDEYSVARSENAPSENMESNAPKDVKIDTSDDGGENSVTRRSTDTSDEKIVQDVSRAVSSNTLEEEGSASSAADAFSDHVSPPSEQPTTSLEEYMEAVLAQNYASPYPTPTLREDLDRRLIFQKILSGKEYTYPAVMGFGFHRFMSYAAHFCKYEASNAGVEIISVGSGNGDIEGDIVDAYRRLFGGEIKITLVDPKPQYKADFKTVDDLIEQRPNVVGNCVLFIIWPDVAYDNDGYDIDAIRKLQPLAALTLCEPTEISGSRELRTFIYHKLKNEDSSWSNVAGGDDERESYGLDNYIVERVASQDVYSEARKGLAVSGDECVLYPSERCYRLRLVKFKRK